MSLWMTPAECAAARPRCRLRDDFEGAADLHFSGGEQIAKRFALDVLHDDEIAVSFGSHVMNRHDVRLIEGRNGPRLV